MNKTLLLGGAAVIALGVGGFIDTGEVFGQNGGRAQHRDEHGMDYSTD